MKAIVNLAKQMGLTSVTVREDDGEFSFTLPDTGTVPVPAQAVPAPKNPAALDEIEERRRRDEQRRMMFAASGKMPLRK